ncbi:transcription termination factor MTERF5, chloroplastic [Trifolium repens]|nr:transcription termination factor MTERF5, chloroplastic [Trifolium repens]
MVHQPFSSSSYSSFSPFFPLQIKSKSLQLFNTPPPYLYLKNNLTLPLIIHHHFPSPCSLHSSTNTSDDSTSFAVSYLIKTFDFSPKFASKLCNTYDIRFKTAENPDSVLNFFRNNGFSDTQLRYMIPKAPWLLSCNLSLRVIPKFEFLLSKGASKADIFKLISKSPMVLSPSLENHTIPTYELLYRFMKSDKKTIALLIHKPYLLSSHIVSHNIKMLVDIGVTDSAIIRLLKLRNRLIQTNHMSKLVEEVKNSGFNPSTTTFVIALIARENKLSWKEKVDTFKKWGWSDEDVIEAFKKQPHCMLTSIDKINSVMNFWVNQMGWDARAIAKAPHILSLSLEKRITTRAPVVQFLLQSGLQKENASLTYPFVVSEKLFRDAYLKRYKEESYLLKLYEETLDLACTDKNGMR